MGIDVELLGEDLTVAAALVEHQNKIGVLKDVLYFWRGQKIFDILSDSSGDLNVISRQLSICLSGVFTHFQRCVISHPA